MELRFIEEEKTEVKLSNKWNKGLIEQLKFFGAESVKESKLYTYFRFPGDFNKTLKMLGVREEND